MNWEDVSPVAVIVALLGTGGAGLFAREIADIASKVRAGISTKESKRKADIVAERNAALAEAAQHKKDAEQQRVLRIGWQEYAGKLLFLLSRNGITATPLPDELEDTLSS